MIEATQLELDLGIGEISPAMSVEDQIHDRFWRISEAITTLDDSEAHRQLADLKVMVLDLLAKTLQQ